LSTEDKDPDNLPFDDEEEFTLELDLPPAEEAIASRPITPQKSKDSTITLMDQNPPAGANLQSEVSLEPLLAGLSEPQEESEPKALPPDFFGRLAIGKSPEGIPKIMVKKEAPLTWSLTSRDLWPVYVRRHVLKFPCHANDLKMIALASKHFASNRVALSPLGDLDLFFNDKSSLIKASSELGDLGRELKGIPASISMCRGLLFCPLAAVDTFGVERDLIMALKGAKFQKGGALVSISIHGCPAKGGPNCGVLNFTDFRLIGTRLKPPLMDQELLKISPHLKKLIAECPGKALSQSQSKDSVMDLDPDSCLRCGLCLHLDPSFHFPGPQESRLTLECSGRHKILEKSAFREPRILLEGIGDNKSLVFQKLAALIKLWQNEKKQDELVYDYLERSGGFDFFRS
jgi:dissimilatory sulfite reductase (desulfoviridin) alpha/beta subunit